MPIACLGWGSLVWDPGNLSVQGDWHRDGPRLPVESVRQSNDGRLTLVIFEGAADVTTLWAVISGDDLDHAVEDLAEREEIPSKNTWRDIGIWRQDMKYGDESVRHRVGEWAREKDFEAVIWTDLPPKFCGEVGRAPSLSEAAIYLGGLEGKTRNKGEEYVRRTPPQIDTVYRRTFERELGWYPQEKDN